MTEILDFFIGS